MTTTTTMTMTASAWREAYASCGCRGCRRFRATPVEAECSVCGSPTGEPFTAHWQARTCASAACVAALAAEELAAMEDAPDAEDVLRARPGAYAHWRGRGESAAADDRRAGNDPRDGSASDLSLWLGLEEGGETRRALLQEGWTEQEVDAAGAAAWEGYTA